MFGKIRKFISRPFISWDANVSPDQVGTASREVLLQEPSIVEAVSPKNLWKIENEERTHRRRLISEPYRMALDEFSRVVVPTMCRFAFVPSQFSLQPEIIKNLWLASTPCSETDWELKYAASEATDALWHLHPATLEVCNLLRRNYEVLRRAEVAGCDEVKIVFSSRCDCLSGLDGDYLKIDAAMKAFQESSENWLSLLVRGACVQSDSPRICDVSFITVEPMQVGEDTQFSLWLRGHLQPKRT